jgi:poly-gamma-glutamate capsule biosynthesis protein CapA/YwtB (metallophosphatase superfamily)
MKILIGGDISFGRVFKGECISYSAEGCLDDLSLIPRDYSIVNLESPICANPLEGVKHDNSHKVLLYAQPRDVLHLKKAGLDYVSLANNHALDHGLSGVKSTVGALEKISISHSGTTDKYYLPHVDYGKKLVIFSIDLKASFSFFSPVMGSRNLPELLEMVSRARHIYPDWLLVVCCHWGVEYSQDPNTFQINLGHKLIDLGVDMIVGSHPHVTQPVEIHKGKPIFYSMGNLYFTHHNRKYDSMAETHQALISVVDFQGRTLRGIESYEGYIQSGVKVVFR